MASNYTVPTRIESIFGSGGRRRPASSTVGPPDLRAEAWAIPHGEGGNLDDRQLMILCYLSPMERHKRASLVFTQRGEWYTKYRYMTTKDDNFLAMCSMPRLAVPRWCGDRPASRNVAQIQLEEADLAKRHAGAGVQIPRYKVDKPAKKSVSNGASILDFSSVRLPNLRIPQSAQTPNYGPVINIDAALIPDLIEADVRKFLWANATDSITTVPIFIDVNTMCYQEVCATILQIFHLCQPGGLPIMYVDTMLAQWTNPETGFREIRYVYEHNWAEIASFLIQHPAQELALGFGLALVEEFAEEEHAEEYAEEAYIQKEDGADDIGVTHRYIDPMLLGQ